MKFHLNYIPKKASFQVDHNSSIFLMGSCFAENIGNQLKEHKFRNLSNPDGILFNPFSIFNSLQAIIHSHKIADDLLLERDGLFYSYMHHSTFSAPGKAELLKKLEDTRLQSAQFLKTADVLIITFGTAFTYYHKQLAQTVANCHKQPSSTFDKKLLEVDEITTLYSTLLQDLKAFNPHLKIIFTVSPVKYLKDGIEENNLSKATLLLSIHKLIAQQQHCFYFPAFELVNDDLRDYRFYKEDLAHPNQLAIEYIWQKFSECYFPSKTIELNQQIQKLNLALNHRQMQEGSLETAKLKHFIEKQKQEIRKSDPGITFE